MLGGNKDAERARPRAVAQRRLEDLDLAIEGDEQALAARDDLGRTDLEHPQIVASGPETERRFERQPHQRDPALWPCDAEPELAAIDRLAPAERRRGQRVLVVADEYDRRPAWFGPAGGADREPVEREISEASQRGEKGRDPLREPPVPAPPLAVDDHEGIETDRRVVDENAPVDLGNVERPGVRRRDHRDRAGKRRRNAKVLGEVVQGP